MTGWESENLFPQFPTQNKSLNEEKELLTQGTNREWDKRKCYPIIIQNTTGWSLWQRYETGKHNTSCPKNAVIPVPLTHFLCLSQAQLFSAIFCQNTNCKFGGTLWNHPGKTNCLPFLTKVYILKYWPVIDSLRLHFPDFSQCQSWTLLTVVFLSCNQPQTRGTNSFLFCCIVEDNCNPP